jgi:putative transcriptional regulator
MKPQLLRRVVELLRDSGFHISDCEGSRSCFDLLARKGKLLLVIKVLSNIEGFNWNTAHELKKVSSITGGFPIVVGDRLKSSRLLDGVLYERYGLHAVSVSTLGNMLSNSMPVAHSIRGNYCATVNSEMLRKMRSHLDLTQEELARELGVSKQSVYRYESTGRVVFDVMERMLKLFERNNRLLVHENVFQSPGVDESHEYRMHVPSMKKLVAGKLEGMGFTTSITNAPFDVVARDDETVYAVVTDDQRRIGHKISLIDDIIHMVGGYGLVVTNRQVSSRRKSVLRPEDLDDFDSSDDLIDRLR